MPALGSWSQGTHWSQGLGWRYVVVFWGDSPPSYPLLSHKITRLESVPLPFRVSEGWWRMGLHSAGPSWHRPPASPSGILGTVLPGPHGQPLCRGTVVVARPLQLVHCGGCAKPL